MPKKTKPVKSPETEAVARCSRSGSSIRRGRTRCDQCAWSQYRQPCPTVPSEAALEELLVEIKDTGGAEVLRGSWSLAEVLAARGLITLGAPRGPGGDWRRAELVSAGPKPHTQHVPDFAELETRTLAAGAKREPVESMAFAEMYGSAAPLAQKKTKATIAFGVTDDGPDPVEHGCDVHVERGVDEIQLFFRTDGKDTVVFLKLDAVGVLRRALAQAVAS